MLRRDLKPTSPAISPNSRSKAEDGSGVEKFPLTVTPARPVPVGSLVVELPCRPMITPHSSPSGSASSSSSPQMEPPVKVKVFVPLQLNRNDGPSSGGGAQAKLRGIVPPPGKVPVALKVIVKLVIAASVPLITVSDAVQVSAVVPVQAKVAEMLAEVPVRKTASQIFPVVPPQPLVNTMGSTPSARATEAEIPRNATTPNKYMNFTVNPPLSFLRTEQPESGVQFCCHATRVPPVQSTCNHWL